MTSEYIYQSSTWINICTIMYLNDCEYMKIIYVDCKLRNEYESDLRCDELYLSSAY